MTWENCQKCDLCHHRLNVVEMRGGEGARILFVEGFPTMHEDISGEPLQNPAESPFFHSTLASAGLSIDQVAFSYVVGCCPPDGRRPFLGEMSACRERIIEDILEVDPLIIVVMGQTAAMSLLDIKKPVSKMQLRKFILDIPVPSGIVQYPCIITYDLKTVLRNPSKRRNQPWHFLFRAFKTAQKVVQLVEGE